MLQHGSHLVGGPALMFAMGLLMSLNPCMLAMLPLAGRFATGRGRGVAIWLGFAAALAAQGWAAGWLGGLLGGLQQALPYLLGTLYLVLGASLLHWWGIFGRLLPLAVHGFYVHTRQRKPSNSSGLPGALSLGAALGFTPAPCTTPVVLAVLGYAAYQGEPARAGLLLLFFGLGHGLPLALAGALGGWMRRFSLPWLRPAGGLILLALGFYFLFAA